MCAHPLSATHSRAHAARLRDLEALVGSTPLLEISCRVRGRELSIFAKHESLNFTGSIKDRMALRILQEAYADGSLHPGDTIVEATSGNTGIAFVALGRALGHPVKIFMPDWMSCERKQLIRSYGGEIVLVSKEQGGFVGSIAMAEAYAAETPGTFLPRQFENAANARAHRDGTVAELLTQMSRIDSSPTAFVAGVGTGGTVMGAAEALRTRVPRCTVHPLEPSNSPTLRTGRRVGSHRIQGISDEFIPRLLDLSALDEIVDVDDGEAIAMTHRLAFELGLGLGISSGANFLGAVKLALTQGEGSVAATVFADCIKKYLSTDLCAEHSPEPKGLAAEVELLEWRALPF